MLSYEGRVRVRVLVEQAGSLTETGEDLRKEQAILGESRKSPNRKGHERTKRLLMEEKMSRGRYR